MKPIKTIAGELLLLMYTLYRNEAKLERVTIEFYDQKADFSAKGIDNLKEDIIQIAESPLNAYNGLKYLEESGFIHFDLNISNVWYLLYNLEVTASGIDIIEGIERGEQERDYFYLTFNIQVNNNVNIDSLIKAEIGSLIKAALI